MTFPTPAIVDVLADVADERIAQVEKWGEQHHIDNCDPATIEDFAELAGILKHANGDAAPDWTGILLEEVYEALAESDPVKLRAELVQVAAVAVSWIEDIDSRGN